ncbi:hypothetical protein Taro_028451 [Colocasia esculenta]|uniref:Uncharacterized protein n=1 Tax=Colocasia esculenta TaxID=4460 RepID=A0A843VXA0_COLES|nr:hypothetical protein [Colocasia esculenta]
MLITKGVTGVKVQPTHRLRTCAKAKKTYGGLDEDSLVQLGVFPVERWSMPRKYNQLVGYGRAPKPRRLTEALTRIPWSS